MKKTTKQWNDKRKQSREGVLHVHAENRVQTKNTWKPTQIQDQSTRVNEQIHIHSPEPSDAYE